ncbi:MAG TPA: class I SAM-dependent methyltransferase [Thermoanaerobaculia bacterium]|nr:class I SAM-dependent methyltransferase [Thermoanaerobaculia bacterium]HQR68872.1 class I SAM-dependent methyltransferase [Thermoanaerobaculia bacterium]
MNVDPDVAAHNAAQRRYFEETPKPGMVPADTPYLNRQVDEIVAFAGARPGERILEVGCGMGRYTLLLAARGLAVEGIDLSPVLLERLTGYAGDRFRIPVHAGDVAAPPPGLRNGFDVVLGLFALHHMKDLEGCFRGMAALVKPGGRVVFLEPNAYNPLYYVQILVRPGMTWEGDGGMMKMRRQVVLGAMERAGLVRTSLRRFGFFPPFLANRPWGGRLERRIEAFRPLEPVLPFQLFRGERP